MGMGMTNGRIWCTRFLVSMVVVGMLGYLPVTAQATARAGVFVTETAVWDELFFAIPKRRIVGIVQNMTAKTVAVTVRVVGRSSTGTIVKPVQTTTTLPMQIAAGASAPFTVLMEPAATYAYTTQLSAPLHPILLLPAAAVVQDAATGTIAVQITNPKTDASSAWGVTLVARSNDGRIIGIATHVIMCSTPGHATWVGDLVLDPARSDGTPVASVAIFAYAYRMPLQPITECATYAVTA